MKAVLTVAIIFFMERSLAGVVVNSTIVDSDLDALCTTAAHADGSKCIELGHDDQQKCLTNIALQYIKCTVPDLAELDFLEEIVPKSIESTEFGPITIDNIKCIIDLILDLIKCIVDGELKPDVPFIWDWKVLINCVLTKVTNIVACLPF